MEAFQNKNKRPRCILAESGPLRSGNANVFAFKRGENAVICPVKGVEMYFNICTLLRIELQYLFRSVTKERKISFKALEPQAT